MTDDTHTLIRGLDALYRAAVLEVMLTRYRWTAEAADRVAEEIADAVRAAAARAAPQPPPAPRVVVKRRAPPRPPDRPTAR